MDEPRNRPRGLLGAVVAAAGMNRHARRAADVPKRVPPLRIQVIRIDPVARVVTVEPLSMSPAGAQEFMGKVRWHSATIGHEHGVDLVLMGDNFPQNLVLGDLEPTWVMRNDNYAPGPICHGIGALIGVAPGKNGTAPKATSCPIGIDWVTDRIEWDPAPEDVE